MNNRYVYTLAAARARFRRGASKVGFFVPGVGAVVVLTPANIDRFARRLRGRA